MASLEKDLYMARKIAERVREEGGRAYFAGDCVRDRLLGREIRDLDLEIHGIAPEILEKCLQELGRTRVVGNAFGIFLLDGYGLDIAMPRKEQGRAGEGLAERADPFAGTEKAARRRDLTINAMMEDVLTGEILDHFGGRQDLEQGIVRHVDGQTFRQDPLRVLRAAGLAARLGFALAEETAELGASLDLSGLARERVWAEVEKVLLKAEKPSAFFELLRQMDQLEPWFPELKALAGVAQEPAFHPEGDVWNHTMLVLDQAAALRDRARYPLGFMAAALCHDLGKITATAVVGGRIRALGHEEAGIPLAGALLGRMTRANRLREYVANMVLLHMRPNILAAQRSSPKAMCRLYDRSREPEDLLLLAKADHCSRPGAAGYGETEAFLREMLELYRSRMAAPGVTGEDLIREGFAPGPDFREALELAHRLKLAGVDRENARKQTLAFLRKRNRNPEK